MLELLAEPPTASADKATGGCEHTSTALYPCPVGLEQLSGRRAPLIASIPLLTPPHPKERRRMRAAPLLLARLSAGGESCGPGSLKWAVATGGPIYSSAAVSKDGGTVYVGSVDQKLHALTAARGERVWSFATQGPVLSSPTLAADGNSVLVGSGDQHVYAVTKQGQQLWNYSTEDVVYSSPAVGRNGSVYVGDENNNLCAPPLPSPFHTDQICPPPPPRSHIDPVLSPYCRRPDREGAARVDVQRPQRL